jgi:WD40 repeat protein
MNQFFTKASTWLIIGLVTAGCIGGQDNRISAVAVPGVRTPNRGLDRADLQSYTLAYCWRLPQKGAFGDQRTDVIVSQGDGNRPVTITYPIQGTQSVVSLGCFGRGNSFRTGGYGLAWRPMHSQLTMVSAASGPPGDHFFFVDVQDTHIAELPLSTRWGHGKYFFHPNGLTWSSSGERLATLAEDADSFPWQNIWTYDPNMNTGMRVTDVRQVPTYVENAVWSSSGDLLAINYGVERSGVGIFRESDSSLIEVSNRNQALLVAWPHRLGQIFGPQEIFQSYLASSSKPAWTAEDQQIIFIAPTSAQRTALFAVNADGTNLQELLPELQGLVGLPVLAPDGNRLAFVRYPGWEARDRAEIAVVDMNTKKLTSLAVLPAPTNGDELYISGLDWTPDGKYVAFSSNHEGESNIYVISTDGKAWADLTDKLAGDAVSPIWKP